MELFANILNSFLPLTILAKCSVLDVRLGSEYASEVKDTASFRSIVSYINYSKMKINQTLMC